MTGLLTLPRAIAGGAILALLILCLVQRTELVRKDVKIAGYTAAMERARSSLDLSAERIRSAREKARANDLAHARAVEAARAAASQETANDLEEKLAAARADAAAYARRLRDAAKGAASPGGGGERAGMSGASGAAAPAAADSDATELDAAACAEAVTIAEGWQDWWKKISAISR